MIISKDIDQFKVTYNKTSNFHKFLQVFLHHFCFILNI